MKPYITVTQGMRGYYAVLLIWQEDGEFWEPYTTSDYDSMDRAEVELYAKDWANAEGLEYRE